MSDTTKTFLKLYFLHIYTYMCASECATDQKIPSMEEDTEEMSTITCEV